MSRGYYIYIDWIKSQGFTLKQLQTKVKSFRRFAGHGIAALVDLFEVPKNKMPNVYDYRNQLFNLYFETCKKHATTNKKYTKYTFSQLDKIKEVWDDVLDYDWSVYTEDDSFDITDYFSGVDLLMAHLGKDLGILIFLLRSPCCTHNIY